MADPFDINRRLPPGLSGVKARLDANMLTVSLARRFGTMGLEMDEAGNAKPFASDSARSLAAWAHQARDGYAEIYEAHWRHMADPTLPEAGRLVRSGKQAKARMAALQREFDQASNAAKVVRDSLLSRLEAATRPPSDAGQIAIDAEVRAAIRAEKNEARRMDLARQYRRAVTTAPELLTGIGQRAHDALTREYWQEVAPDTTGQLREIDAARAAAETAHKALHAGAREIIDFDRVSVLESYAADHAKDAA